MQLISLLTIKTDGKEIRMEKKCKKIFFCPKAGVMTQRPERESSGVTGVGQGRRVDFQPQGFCLFVLLSVVVVCFVVVSFLRKGRGSSPKVFIYAC